MTGGKRGCGCDATERMIRLALEPMPGVVAWTGSAYPDLLIGSVAGLLALNGVNGILAPKGLLA